MKILLCDDQRMMRACLRAILEKEGLEVVGEAENGREVLALAEQIRPDIVVMAILDGVDATRQLLMQSPSVRVLALSRRSERYVAAMLAAGVRGCLLKSCTSEELVRAIQAVAAEHRYLSPSIVGTLIDAHLAQLSPSIHPSIHPSRMPSPPGPIGRKTLSKREGEVLQLLAEGQTSKEISLVLGIACTTVETHRRQIMDKLALRTIAELTKYAVREGLTSLE